MALYLIGDVQGCDEPLGRLLDTIGFSPSRDTLFVLGDLVNRGPQSAAVMRRLMDHGDAARCLLGNHDLSLLAVAHGHRTPHPLDTLDPVLRAPDREALLDWLRHRPLALRAHGLLMVHAGVLPSWDADQVMRLAGEVESALRASDADAFLSQMFGNEPARWSDTLTGTARLRVVVNALTRLRFCTADGTMLLKASGAPDQAPEGGMPWFTVPGRRTADICMAVGHWSTLGVVLRPDLLALDSGCVWGGCLSALRLHETDPLRHELIQVPCEQAQVPGPMA
ncbi:symmetrical bis(5'-nucleosyl)-tetraphosphatase [Ramlibacter sp. AW1]|uniref:bis(5'-nucleosyl)-tetraphosphatase (symmetrical) n=1 Tax=Ramlibacter aurantiacus TaxID=2801330 RepID=A0A936ZT06_9BURK|nr:symmetrical bis(5'-nucleosyl)-tetraphosphatase [Ramlibacter aurantiacus]MBL0422928.1 symmetrical bis(5'-nucleosyl)-tetraphosphatase [Ramlibacter aurantiacus]